MNDTYKDLLIKVGNSKDEALKQLSTVDGHEILDGKFARAVGKAFGVEIEVGSMRDTRSQFKGATIDGAKEGEVADDLIGAMELSTQLCRKLDVDYGDRYGRGSQFDACLLALKQRFEKVPA